jgi:hypothetical protein
MFWIWLWQTTLVVTLGLFACMAVATTIGGARDVRRLLRSLDQVEGDDKDTSLALASPVNPKDGGNVN